MDGVDDGVNLGNPAGFGSQVGDFSVSLWVKLGLALDAENSLVPILSNAQNNTGMELQLKLHPDPTLNGILYFYTYQNGGYTRLWTDAGAFPDDGQWHHIAATLSASSGKLYLDGVLVEGKTLAPPDDATAPLWLGTDPAGRAWPGSMDQVRLYDRALASHEVLAHFLNADQRYGLWTGDNTLEDASGNAHHGTALGTETYQPGIKGQALSFNGTNDTLDLGNPPALSQGLTSFSVTAWVKLDKTLGTEDVDHTLIGNKDATQGGFTLKLEDHTTTPLTGRIKVSCYNGGTTDSLTGTGHHYLADGDWHQVAFTLEGGTGTLYVDGLQIASKPMITPGDSTNALYLGSHLGSTNHWIGAVDEVQFYRRGLEAEEIQSDYLTWAPASHRNPQEDPGLTAQWDFDNDYQNIKDAQNPAVPSGSLSFVEGKQNDALQLDGTATVDLGATADVTLDHGTITLWAKLESPLGTSNSRYVLLANHDATSGFRIIIDDDTDPAQAGNIQFTSYTATTTNALTSGSTPWPSDATWHHLAVTKAGPTANMYLDGVLIATTDTLNTPDPVTHPLSIGATGAGHSYPWAGAIDQVKIYTTALTPYAILGTYLEGDPDLSEAVTERTLGALNFQLIASDTDPYGLQYREIYDPSVTEREPHGFTGQEKEPDLGLYYMGGRWYFAELGRFLQADPMREFWNSYSYVGNNPIILVDPTGSFGEPALAGYVPVELKKKIGELIAGEFGKKKAGKKIAKRLHPVVLVISSGVLLYKVTRLVVEETGIDNYYADHLLVVFPPEASTEWPGQGNQSNPNPSLQTQTNLNRDNEENNGQFTVRIQAQGVHLETSIVNPDQTRPVSVSEGLAMVNNLEASLPKRERKIRAEAFRQARTFIERAGKAGGARKGRSFRVRGTSHERVDVEILRGVNFVP